MNRCFARSFWESSVTNQRSTIFFTTSCFRFGTWEISTNQAGGACADSWSLWRAGVHWILLNAEGNPDVRDAGLIGAAQRVEHYEIAGYGTARSLAERLGDSQVAGTLQLTLNEEAEADKKLTSIAESGVNISAASGKRR